VVIHATQTRAESLAATIERNIATRGLAAGDPLGTMDDLRDQSGYARSTVSEAVRLLRDRGSIDIRPGRGGGLFVAAANPVVRLRHTLLTVREEASTVADAIVVREALEPAIDTDAARHRTAADMADLRNLVSAMRKTIGSTDNYMRSNWALHERIAEITPNQLLKGVYLGTTRCIADLSTHAANDNPESQRAYLRERVRIHADLVKAIISGDVALTLEAVARHAGA
jgi:GntR family transcriptional repressor for pyruvate dehydrogenase complex